MISPVIRCTQKLEQVLVNSIIGEPIEEDIKAVCDFYGSDLNQADLISQLHILRVHFQQSNDGIMSLQSIIFRLKAMSTSEKALIQEVVTLAKLILTMPATNATSERSFSAMRQVKSYLRTTMTQKRLIHLMLMHIHRDWLDKLDLKCITNEFCAAKEYRLRIFGLFK